MLARLLTFIAAAACVLAYFFSPVPLRAVLGVVALGAFLYTLCPGRKNWPTELLIDSRNAVRGGRGSEVVPLTFDYCAADYVCLSATRQPLRLSVWPDSLDAGHWRRLQVAGRWPHAESAVASALDKDRTK